MQILKSSSPWWPPVTSEDMGWSHFGLMLKAFYKTTLCLMTAVTSHELCAGHILVLDSTRRKLQHLGRGTSFLSDTTFKTDSSSWIFSSCCFWKEDFYFNFNFTSKLLSTHIIQHHTNPTCACIAWVSHNLQKQLLLCHFHVSFSIQFPFVLVVCFICSVMNFSWRKDLVWSYHICNTDSAFHNTLCFKANLWLTDEFRRSACAMGTNWFQSGDIFPSPR